MFRRILISIAPAVLAAFSAAPALAQPSPPGLEIRIATTAPPHARHEAVSPRPDHDSVWIKGYWGWDGGRWGWTNARWERPGQKNHTWVAPRYVREGKAWRYEPPHWSHQQVTESEEYRHWKLEHHRS